MNAVRMFSSVLICGLVGCSGASASEILDPTPSELSKTEPAPTTTSGASAPSGSSTKPGDPGAGPDGKDKRAKEPLASGCAGEIEPNDSAELAMTFASCASGKLANARDVDFLRVVAPPNARRMNVSHDESNGRIAYRVSRESRLLNIPFDTETFTDDAPDFRVAPGETYLFRLSVPSSGSNNGERPYELKVSFSGED
jgi:hypothetical protein